MKIELKNEDRWVDEDNLNTFGKPTESFRYKVNIYFANRQDKQIMYTSILDVNKN